jgi:hypothetical protein
MSIVDFLLSTKFNKVQRYFIKLLLRSVVRAKVEIKFSDDNYGNRNAENFTILLSSYKTKGYSKMQVIEIFNKDLDSYKMNFPALPRLVFDHWELDLK